MIGELLFFAAMLVLAFFIIRKSVRSQKNGECCEGGKHEETEELDDPESPRSHGNPI